MAVQRIESSAGEDVQVCNWPKVLGAERHLRATKIHVLKQPQILFRMCVGGWGDPWQKEHGEIDHGKLWPLTCGVTYMDGNVL